MCRLLGLISPQTAGTPEQFIFGMLTILSGRLGNSHGTGTLTSGNGVLSLLKYGAPAEQVIYADEWKAWMQEHPGRHLIGHTRLASLQWRRGYSESYPPEDSHPFLVGKSFLAHNGLFKDHGAISARFGLDKNTTDTRAFVRLLEEVLGDKKLLGPEYLEEALRAVGEAEYCLLAGTNDATYAVRGNRDLHVAASNYGLLVSTTKVNLTDLPPAVDVSLTAFDHARLELGEIVGLEPWSIYQLSAERAEKIGSIEALKEVNEPPTKHVVHSRTVTGGGRKTHVSWADITDVARLAVEILQTDEMLTEPELQQMLQDITGEDHSHWFKYDTRHLETLHSVLRWAMEKHPELKPTKDKQILWLQFMIDNEFDDPIDAYKRAKLLHPDFVCPWFLNTRKELEVICSSAKKK